MEERMRREHDGVEEERVEVGRRREELRREVEAWEAAMETVGLTSFISINTMQSSHSFKLHPKIP